MKKFAYLIIIMFLSVNLFADDPNYQNVLKDIVKSSSVDYMFKVKDPITHEWWDCTSKIVYFKTKKNLADVTLKINKTCSIDYYFNHSGVTGSIDKDDTVTGATSGAIGTVMLVGEIPLRSENFIVIDVTSGTFQSGEQVYETINVNYVTLSNAGYNSIATTRLSITDTALPVGSYFAHVQVTNANGDFNKYALKSSLEIVNY